MDVLDGAAEQGGTQDALGHLGRLLGAVLRVQVEQRQVDVALQVRREPRSQVGALC